MIGRKLLAMSKTSSPVVSVVIPCYNGEEFVAEAIESVFSQTYPSWELIIVNDGSDDNSRKVINQFDDRITVISHDENRGIAAAMNTGIRNASGEFIAFLDQDDLWKEDKLLLSVQEMGELESPGLVQTGLENRDDQHNEKKIIKAGYGDIPDRALARDLLLRTKPFYSSSTMMVSKRAIGEVGLFDERLTRWADQEMWIRVLSHPEFSSTCVPKSLVIKRSHSDQATQDTREVIEDWINLHDIIMTNHQYLRRYRNKHLSIILENDASHLWQQGKKKRAIKTYMKSLYYCPLNWRSIVGLGLSGMGEQGWKIRQCLAEIKTYVETRYTIN